MPGSRPSRALATVTFLRIFIPVVVNTSTNLSSVAIFSTPVPMFSGASKYIEGEMGVAEVLSLRI